MKIVTSENIVNYQDILQHMQENESLLIIWQVAGDQRKVFHSKLVDFNINTKLLRFNLPPHALLERSLTLYCYAEDGELIFKSGINEIRQSDVLVVLPSEIKLLERAEVTVIRGNLGLSEPDFLRVKSLGLNRSERDKNFLTSEIEGTSLDHEEILFSSKRESPRSRPKEQKYVKVSLATDDKSELFKLFDLSRGGLSFIVTDTQLFPKEAKVVITGFGDFDLDDPLFGKIMSHRLVDEAKSEWKIGVKFEEDN